MQRQSLTTIFIVALFIFLTVMTLSITHQPSSIADTNDSLYTFTMKTIDGAEKSLADYKGHVLLIVNTASECGYTPQYETLQKLYEKYESQGLRILAFPANNFGSQEPGTDAEIKKFCSTNYHVTFDLFSKISVKGDDQHPLYRFITHAPGVEGDVRWNFQKYIADKSGKLIAKISHKIDPLDASVTSIIETELSK